MADDRRPGRPGFEAVFVAFVVTTVAGLCLAHVLARLLPPSPPPGSPPAAAPLTLTVLFVSVAFAAAQAVLPGPTSTGVFGLAIPLAGAVTLAVRGVEASSVVSALFGGVFLTPAAYYVAIRLSFSLSGQWRRRPVGSSITAVAGAWLVWQAARLVTFLADRSTGGRFW